VRVRFNAEEAIDELLRLNLICDAERDGDGTQHYDAVPPGEAYSLVARLANLYRLHTA